MSNINPVGSNSQGEEYCDINDLEATMKSMKLGKNFSNLN